MSARTRTLNGTASPGNTYREVEPAWVSTIRIATIGCVIFPPHLQAGGTKRGRYHHAWIEMGCPVAVAGAVATGAVAVGTLQAQDPPPPIAVEVLTQRAVFTDNVKLQIRNKLDGHATHVSNSRHPSRTVVAKHRQRGPQFPWHTHPGPVIVNIAQGEPPTSWPTTASTGRIPRDRLRGSRPRHGPHGRQPNGRSDGAAGDLLRSATDRTVDHPRRGSGRLHALTDCGEGPLFREGPRHSNIAVDRCQLASAV